MLKTLGAAIGAAVVILLLAAMASRITWHTDPMAPQSVVRR
jgi:Na+-translocating ferredoxin:NAD+ oxidoreductase RnfA subunit